MNAFVIPMIPSRASGADRTTTASNGAIAPKRATKKRAPPRGLVPKMKPNCCIKPI